MKISTLKPTLLVLLVVMCMVAFGSNAYAGGTGSAAASVSSVDSEEMEQLPLSNLFDEFLVDSSLQTFFVSGDEGRFRQDWLKPTDTSGGGSLSFNRVYDNGWSYEMEGHAIVDYDYGARLLIESPDQDSLLVDWRRIKKYWDGSTEPFTPETYAVPDEFADFDDDDMYTDRNTLKVQTVKTLGDTAKGVLTYDMWKREGRHTLLRGSRLRLTGDTVPRARSRVATARVDGWSHRIELAVPVILDDIHHVTPSISYEGYRDSQFIHHPRYRDGALEQDRTFIDSPEFDDLKVKLLYEAWLNEKTHVNAGYMFNYLWNRSTRSSVRPNLGNPNHYVNPDVNNGRMSNVLNAGAVLLDIAGQENLDARVGTRFEHALTDTYSAGFNSGGVREANSHLREVNTAQSGTLTYRKKKTTVKASLDLEQRKLTWKETFDTTGHEITTVFTNRLQFANYETDITHVDIVPTLKVTHRFNDRVKAFLKYRAKIIKRFYNPDDDTMPMYYPGILGDLHRYVNEVTLNTSIRLSQSWTSNVGYNFLSDVMNWSIGDRQQDMDRHRLTASAAGPLVQSESINVFSFFNATYEHYRVGTPTVPSEGGTNRWGGPQTGPYRYNGDNLILSANFTSPLTNRISAHSGYQFVGSLGDNNNTLNKVTAGLDFSINEHTNLSAEYTAFNFRDNRGPDGGNDDDYYGHGMGFSFNTALA